MSARKKSAFERPANLTDQIYDRLKREIFDFQLLPGDRFTESEVAARMEASRTPVREALMRLQNDGFVEVQFRSGWKVKPFDFEQLGQFYDIRIILELASVDRLCAMEIPPDLEDLKRDWLVPPEERLDNGPAVCALDERFHERLVEATGNVEMARIHHEITERIRVIRRFDFTNTSRVAATYDEHRKILQAILRRRASDARMLLSAHIETSKSEVRKITLHMLEKARA